VWGGAACLRAKRTGRQKIERKWFLSGGRRNGVKLLARISVVGAGDIVWFDSFYVVL